MRVYLLLLLASRLDERRAGPPVGTCDEHWPRGEYESPEDGAWRETRLRTREDGTEGVGRDEVEVFCALRRELEI